ncbi:MAG: MlaD family protein [Gemmatimonadota bacterium]
MATEESRRGPSDAEIKAAVPPAAGAHELRVGVFVLIGLISFMLVLFLMTDPASFRGRYMVMTLVDNAGGIRKGDPVQMKGVNIGRVHAFEIQDSAVAITLEIEGEWEIPTDSRTRLASSGLLGGLTVEVVRGQASTLAREGAVLPGAAEGGDLMQTASQIGGQAEAVLGQLREALSDNTVASVEASAIELKTLLETLTRVSRQQGDELARLTASLGRTAQGLEASTPEVQQTLAQADTAMQRLSATAATLEGASASLDTVLGRLARGEGSLGRLSVDDELYENLNRASIALQELLTDLREHPGRYLKISVF